MNIVYLYSKQETLYNLCIFDVQSPTPTLCVPQPGNSLGNADVVGLKRVEGNTQSDGSDTESPHGEVADEGDTLLREVVNNACPGYVSPHMSVVDVCL